MKTKEASEVSPTSFIRAFYEARQTATPDYLLQWLAPNVRWLEPVVGDHMGFLEGADAVLTMLRKAYETTKGTFRLEVTQTIESGNHCSAVVQWEAEKNGKIIHGQELAVFGGVNGLISEAYFFASNIKSDELLGMTVYIPLSRIMRSNPARTALKRKVPADLSRTAFSGTNPWLLRITLHHASNGRFRAFE